MGDSKAALEQVRLAQKALQEQQFFQAAALYRTALAMDPDQEEPVRPALAECLAHLDAAALKGIPHHTYIRMKQLSRQIRDLYPGNLQDIRLLDIGGGAGYLASFLPEVRYVLAEPLVNGISALDLPFPRKSFDCVVSCHVLEHIEEGAKPSFMDNLCDLAVSNVVLLNPFLTGEPAVDSLAAEILQVGWEITGASWAKEHIDSGLPSLDFIRQYAAENRTPLTIAANSSYAVTALYVFMEHFAVLANKQDEFNKINTVFNGIDPALLSNAAFPNDFTCVLDVRNMSKK